MGAVVRRPLAIGEPIVDGNLVKPGDRGFLAAVLDPGMRAVSVPVDEASSNAGLIFPGDRVDLILTQTIEPNGESAGSRRVSETVLQDVRIIAMGRELTSEGGADGEGGKPARTATLEATPAAAEKVALVTELGKLSLSLRSLAIADTSRPAPTGARFT
jgi:pilus assembly protein CpaB